MRWALWSLALVVGGAAAWRPVAAAPRPRPCLRAEKEGRDFYADLGVAGGASAETIKKAFRAAAKTLHPDVRAPASPRAGRGKNTRGPRPIR